MRTVSPDPQRGRRQLVCGTFVLLPNAQFSGISHKDMQKQNVETMFSTYFAEYIDPLTPVTCHAGKSTEDDQKIV